MVAREYKITSARLKELETELNYLKTTREKEVAEQIKEARSFGDLSENSEYDEAKNEQAKLYGRIAEVENILANAVIIEENDEPAGHVGLGCRVQVMDLDLGEEETYTIVGSAEVEPLELKISDESPIGKALSGARVGDVVEVSTPAGKVFTMEVLEINI